MKGLNFLLLIACGNTFLKCNSAGCLVIWVRATYSEALITSTEIMTAKLKEKMMIKREPIIAVIINANSEIGSPIISARFLIFL
jgi:hypothetical protein